MPRTPPQAFAYVCAARRLLTASTVVQHSSSAAKELQTMQRQGRQENVPQHPTVVHGRRRTGLFVALGIASWVAVLVVASSAGAASPMPLDPDQAAKVSSDVNTSLLALDNGTYQLLVQN